MNVISLILFLVFISSLVLTAVYRKWAIKRSVLDIPNERSSHKIPVPRGGGIVIVLTFYFAIIVLFLGGQINQKLFLSLLPGLILAVVGLIDDCRSLSAKFRLIIQVFCAGTALYILEGFIGPFNANYLWFWNIVALVGILWFINLFNFLDGSDGYASMEAMTVSVALYLITGMEEVLVLSMAVGGFLYWNWPKAKIFMGDAGSVTIGYILVVFGIYLNNSGTLNIYFWLILTMLFWFDASITLFKRIINREKLSQAHRKHIYQRAIRSGLSHSQVMISGFIINVLLISVSYFVYLKDKYYLHVFICSIVFLIIIMYYVNKRAISK